MHKSLATVLCTIVFSLGLLATADAALISRAGGLAVYDTDLDVTWLADFAFILPDQGFHSTVGPLFRAIQWIETLNALQMAGASDWRLPTGDTGCGGVFNCIGGEMGHLFYIELDGTAGNSILTSSDPDLALFSDFQLENYWTGTLASSTKNFTFGFINGGGGQGSSPFSSNLNFAAVRSGDIALLVPEPGTAMLMVLGLAGLAGFRSRRRGRAARR